MMNITISDAIVVALIYAAVDLVITFIKKKTKGVEQERKQAARDQHIDDVIERFDDRLDDMEKRLDERLDGMEKRLDSHNNYAERFVSVDKKVDKLDNKMDLLAKDFEYCKRK